MKNTSRIALCLFTLAAIPPIAFAVYAPLPPQDLGKAFTVSLGASVYHDNNIFGGATGKISSAVYSASLDLGFNSSVTDQSFFSLGYNLNNYHVVDRPGKNDLVNHSFTSRYSHSFSPVTILDLSESFQVTDNPASLLNGLPVNTDQSVNKNQINARLQTAAGEKGSVVFKYRNVDTNYNSRALSRSLDRNEHLFGFETAFAVLPETKLVGEYRYGRVNYQTNGAAAVPAAGTNPAFVAQPVKDKSSHYFMAGMDYDLSETTLVTARGGFEKRSRKSLNNTTAPYAEFSINHIYAEGSFVRGSFTHSLEESSDVIRYTDSKVSRFIGTVQHRLSPLVVASSSLTYEAAKLQGRVGRIDLSENATRFGVALTWQPTKNWAVSGTLDIDNTSSDDINRTQDRTRYGIGAKFSF